MTPPYQIIMESMANHEALMQVVKQKKMMDSIVTGAKLMAGSLGRGGKIIAFGCGGSMTQAEHFVSELTGRYRESRRPLAAICLNSPAHLTCVSNDFGFEEAFWRGVCAVGNPYIDTLFALSTSGNSQSVLNAVSIEPGQYHSSNAFKTVALTGTQESLLGHLATVDISLKHIDHHYPFADRIQEVHGFIIHVLVQLIEDMLS